MTKIEIIEDIKSKSKITQIPLPDFGGQSVGDLHRIIKLENEIVNFKIEIDYFRSSMQNLKVVELLFDLYLEEIIK